KARRFFNNESGGTAVEYGLIMALMTLALIGALSATGDGTSDKWNDVANDVSSAVNN
ncbi:MAG: Flp family type IVb pilin, partial [Pseudomonadota bacterium]